MVDRVVLDGEIPLLVPKEMFDHLAANEGQIEDGYKIHDVDRLARTLRYGGMLVKEQLFIKFKDRPCTQPKQPMFQSPSLWKKS